MFSASSFFMVSTSVNKRRLRHHARFAKQNLPKTIVFSMFLQFSRARWMAAPSTNFASKTRFHDLKCIRLISKNAIKTNVFFDDCGMTQIVFHFNVIVYL